MNDDVRRYSDWVAANVTEAYGRCAEVTNAMAASFPELTRVRGHYHCPIWGERAHWWLVTASGLVIDPTKQQFPSQGTGEYVPWDESQEEPTGKCPNCGGLCYGEEAFCSHQCGREYVDFVKRVIP